MGLLYGRAARLTAENGGFRPGQGFKKGANAVRAANALGGAGADAGGGVASGPAFSCAVASAGIADWRVQQRETEARPTL
jgi:hypothetical protein